jgi:opine dehydrogenase
VRDLPDDENWLETVAGRHKGSGSRKVAEASHAQAILRCAVTGSLVPLQSAARLANVATPVTDAMVELASATCGHDLKCAGRRLESMGVQASNVDDARKQLERMTRGRS